MTSPIPEAYVQAHMHGGPHDGEIVPMPWARIEVPMTRWDAEQMLESLYRLSGPWRGQATAHYQYVEPAVEERAA